MAAVAFKPPREDAPLTRLQGLTVPHVGSESTYAVSAEKWVFGRNSLKVLHQYLNGRISGGLSWLLPEGPAGFPEPVKDLVDYALYVAQQAGKHSDAKLLRGFAAAFPETSLAYDLGKILR